MKQIKILVLFLFGLSCGFRATAQQQEPYSHFHFSILPPLSTHGSKAAEYTNGGSFSLLAGISRNERAFAFAGLGNIVREKAVGLQFATVFNRIGSEGKGLAFAGMVNTVSDSYKGVQFSAALNVSGDDTKGVMFAGLTNSTRGGFSGLQLAGVVNIAENVRGVQLGGLVNIAKKVRGVQFSALVNIAQESDCPIGLVNIIKKGEKGIALTYDMLGNATISFRSGGRYTYGILGMGFNTRMRGEERLVTEAGLGAHIPVFDWFRINNELKASTVGSLSGDPTINASYLLAPSFTIWKHYNIFVGGSLNYFISRSADAASLLPTWSLWKQSTDGHVKQLYFGYQVGIQYLF